MKKFKNTLKEGAVYIISQFGVGSNGGSFRSTPHDFKIVFQFSTRVAKTEDDGSIDLYGLRLTSLSSIISTPPDSKCLVGKIFSKNISAGDVTYVYSHYHSFEFYL